MNSALDSFISTVVYMACVFILFLIGKLIYQWLHPKINIKDELVEKDNFAFSIAHTGFFIGLVIAVGGIMIEESSGNFLTDLVDIAIYGGLSVILLNLAILINQSIILRKFSVYDEIVRDQNEGTGIVEAASAIGTGLIIMGSIQGEGGGILVAVIFWIIGQVLLILTSFIYNLIVPYDVHEHIEKDNVAVGIGFAGAIIAIANLVRFALWHDFDNWIDSLTYIGIDVAIGLIFLPIARIMADKLLLPGENLTDELINQEKPNLGAAIIEAFAYIGGSIVITWCL